MSSTVPKKRVLIIDDDPSVRLFIRLLFEHDGFDVTIADNGDEGVRLALLDPPHIIILDIMMEGLNGFEVCKLLRDESSLHRTAIIVISGKSYKPDIDKALELGADAYIVKPYSPEELLATALRHMHERARQS